MTDRREAAFNDLITGMLTKQYEDACDELFFRVVMLNGLTDEGIIVAKANAYSDLKGQK